MFETIFQAADPVMDEVFAQPFMALINGAQVPLDATKQHHEVEADESKGFFESWIGMAFEVNAAEWLVDGAISKPATPQEIAEETDAGYNIYRVLPLPDGRCWAMADPDGAKLIVYAKFVRTEVSL